MFLKLMSIFSLFGPSIKYSQVPHPVLELDIKRMVSQIHVNTLTQGEADLAETAILAQRRDGKLSLQHIYEALHSLFNKHKISRNDQDGVMNLFINYYQEHFGE